MISIRLPVFVSTARRALALLALAAASLAPAPRLVAQGSVSPERPAPVTPLPAPNAAGSSVQRAVTADTPDATRAELQSALARLGGSAGDRAQADAIRRRLETGDFRIGDRFVMTLAVDSVIQRELAVRDSLLVEMPPLAPLSLRGVLRSEIQIAVLRHMQRYYRNPEVRVQTLTRVGVVGAVSKPGFYVVAPDAGLNEVVQLAGGVAQNANLTKAEVWRYDRRFLNAKQFNNGTRSGRALSELGVRSGDEIRVPEKRNFNWSQTLWTVTILISSLLTVITLIRSVNGY
jgi:hypothetical protein